MLKKTLSSHLKEAAIKIQAADNLALDWRQQWNNLDQRIDSLLKALDGNELASETLGNLYKVQQKDDSVFVSSGLQTSQIINSTTLSFGPRALGVYKKSKDSKQYLLGSEEGCHITFSQGPSGQVAVLLGPYRSNLGEVQESEIIIRVYKHPDQITTKKIEKHFRVFFYYCVCTSQNSLRSNYRYLYRKWLIAKDLRYRSSVRTKAFNWVERTLYFVGGGIAVWAFFID